MLFEKTGKRGPVKTKEKILLEAATMFTRHGYTAVSIRDIAGRVKIKSASIYAHFSSKEEIFELILDNMASVYLEHYVKLDVEIAKAKCFADVLDCLFDELRKVHNIYIYYGVSLVVTEQFSNAKAHGIFNDVLVRTGVDFIRNKFAMCIRKKWVKKFDTAPLAAMIMNSVIMGTMMRTHELMNRPAAYDVTKMTAAMRRYVLGSVEIVE